MKIRLPCHKFVLIPVRINIKPMLWSCRLSLKMIPWFLFFCNWFTPFFGIFSCFTWFCIVFVLYQITIHLISIFILSINLIIVIIVFVFDQRLLHGLCILNRMADPNNLGMKSALKRFFQFILCILIHLSEHLDSVYIV